MAQTSASQAVTQAVVLPLLVDNLKQIARNVDEISTNIKRKRGVDSSNVMSKVKARLQSLAQNAQVNAFANSEKAYITELPTTENDKEIEAGLFFLDHIKYSLLGVSPMYAQLNANSCVAIPMIPNTYENIYKLVAKSVSSFKPELRQKYLEEFNSILVQISKLYDIYIQFDKSQREEFIRLYKYDAVTQDDILRAFDNYAQSILSKMEVNTPSIVQDDPMNVNSMGCQDPMNCSSGGKKKLKKKKTVKKSNVKSAT